MPITDSQTFVLGPHTTNGYGWDLAANADSQAVASAIAIPDDPETLRPFPVDGAVIELSGPTYSYAGTVLVRPYPVGSAVRVPLYIVRWNVTNRTDDWRAIRLSYTIMSSTPIETVPGLPNKVGGE